MFLISASLTVYSLQTYRMKKEGHSYAYRDFCSHQEGVWGNGFSDVSWLNFPSWKLPIKAHKIYESAQSNRSPYILSILCIPCQLAHALTQGSECLVLYSGPVVKTSFSKTKRADWLPIREKLITLQRIRWTCLFWIDVLGLEVLPHATGCLSRRFPLTDSRWHEIIPDPSASFQTFSIDLVLRRKASVIQFIRSFIIQCFMWTYPVVFIDVCGN